MNRFSIALLLLYSKSVNHSRMLNSVVLFANQLFCTTKTTMIYITAGMLSHYTVVISILFLSLTPAGNTINFETKAGCPETDF